VRELAKDSLPLAFIKRLLDFLRQRQFWGEFSQRFGEGLEGDASYYLVWGKRDYAEDGDFLELVRPGDTGGLERFLFQGG